MILNQDLDINVEVTVLVPSFNQGHFLAECLDSILGQVFRKSFLVLIYDDASTDGSQEVIKKYSEAYPGKIKAILNEENLFSKYHVSALGLIKSIKSPYLAICEADDFWMSENKLQNQYDFMVKNKSWCSISHHDVKLACSDSSIPEVVKLQELLNLSWRTRKRNIGVYLARGNYLITCSVMINLAMIPPTWLEILDGNHPGDYMLFSLAAANGDIGYVENISSAYRIHSTNNWLGASSEYRENQTKRVKIRLMQIAKGGFLAVLEATENPSIWNRIKAFLYIASARIKAMH